jgi:DNA-binding transcriptional regulator YhcF (GntR family)
MEPTATSTINDFLYIQIATRLENQIKQNLLKSGDKLPSVRALSQEQGISLSTAFKAYVELESMGMIEARPKSGYYVKILAARFARAPEVKPPLKKIRQVNVHR